MDPRRAAAIAEDAVARLVDESSFRDATARFADSFTRGDYESFRRLWADDAIWTIGKPVKASAEGSDAIVEMLHGLWDGKEFLGQFAVQGPIDFEGDEA